ncbi:MAG: hypothetical protein LBM21_02960, partial [Coriobacteriales bacterium]|nr:hypothetical protein [Coriobacteriales bacterium]
MADLHKANILHKTFVAFIAFALVIMGTVATPANINVSNQAFADDPGAQGAPQTVSQAQVDTLERNLRSASESYNVSLAKLQATKNRISDAQTELAKLQDQMSAEKTEYANAMRKIYTLRYDNGDFLSVFLGAESLSSSIAKQLYMDRLMSLYASKIDGWSQYQDELNANQEIVDQADASIADAAQKVNSAYARTVDAYNAYAQAVNTKAAQDTAAAIALAASGATSPKEAQNATDTDSDVAPVEGGIESMAPQYPGAINWDVGKQAFVAEWSARINAYLEGSPLAGKGQVFAEAAWENGVDPRWSPAISNTESSKALYCFRQNNAWGWGQTDWPDMDTAIRAHIQALADNYGYT